ncbi:hypothetical protein WMY93_032169 [Mugilogobius chulae]|uniref:V-SNARE coiled-coil homology domain-containing protein n=1 Tax=Mugilogobius chulae TaxID=88201 RepID=A0AAW0MCI3_9GOBI
MDSKQRLLAPIQNFSRICESNKGRMHQVLERMRRSRQETELQGALERRVLERGQGALERGQGALERRVLERGQVALERSQTRALERKEVTDCGSQRQVSQYLIF